MTRRPYVPARRAEKRKTIWVGTAIANALAVASGASVIHSSFAPDALSMLAPTAVRTRGQFTVFPTAFGADLDYIGAFGLGIVSDEAFVAGAASLPRPFDDDDWGGWLVHQYYSGHLEF